MRRHLGDKEQDGDGRGLVMVVKDSESPSLPDDVLNAAPQKVRSE